MLQRISAAVILKRVDEAKNALKDVPVINSQTIRPLEMNGPHYSTGLITPSKPRHGASDFCMEAAE